MIYSVVFPFVTLLASVQSFPLDYIGYTTISTVAQAEQSYDTTKDPTSGVQRGLTTISTILASESPATISGSPSASQNPTAVPEHTNTIYNVEPYNIDDYFTVTEESQTCLYYYETVDGLDDDIYETVYSYSGIFVTEIIYVTSIL